jgi:hypothetical protein
VLDLLAWRSALFAGRVVSNASLTRMTTPAKLNDGSTTGYAYGLGIGKLQGHRRISHGGGINGFITQMAHYPDDDVTVVVLGNLGSSPSSRVANMIARVSLGIALPVVMDVATTAEERARIVGAYAVGNNTLTIREEGGNLMFAGPGGPQRLKSQGDGRYVPERDIDWVIRFTPESGPVQEIAIDTGDNTMKGKRK